LPILKNELGRTVILSVIGLLSWIAISLIQQLLIDLPLLARLTSTSLMVLIAAGVLVWQAGFPGWLHGHTISS